MWVKRSGVLVVLLTVMLAAVLLAVFRVTFSGVGEKAKAVAGSRTGELELYTSKGVIYDRELCALAGNQFAYYLAVDPRGFDRTEAEYLSALTGTDIELITERLQKESVFCIKSYFEPKHIDGVYVYEGTARYSEHPTCVHILGYLDSEGKRGISGVEKSFDTELSEFLSVTSVRYAINARHGTVAGLDDGTVFGGEDTKNGIVLTVDRALSTVVEESAKRHLTKGAAIVMDCDNGELLAISSFPSFDPECISAYIKGDGGELVNNAMVNQVVGSVFKMVTAACALENGLGDFQYECVGAITVSDRTFSCQNSKSHGCLTLDEAFAHSCNSYFIALGQLLGYEKLAETAELFGADSSIEIIKDMSSSSGKLPPQGGAISLANFSIGQGELLLSPLAIARITAVACNGGYLVNPCLYRATYTDGRICNEREYSYKTKIVSDETACRLHDMSVLCVCDGTGTAAAPDIGGAGGKTASAQTGSYKSDGKEVLNTYFTGFYPADSPKYVITVFACDGVSGAKTCAPVFAEICDFIAQNY